MDKNIFLYEVRPRKVIFIPSLQKNVRTPKSYYLTKDDVIEIIKNAHLFRRFSNPIRSVRVTTDAIDRLHNEVYMTEEEYEKYLKQKAGEGSQTVKVSEVKDPEKSEPSISISEKIPENQIPSNEELLDAAKNSPDFKIPEEIVESIKNMSDEEINEGLEHAEKVFSEPIDDNNEVNATENQDIAAENQQKDTDQDDDQNIIGDGSKEEVAETDAVADDEDDTEDSTDYKEGNQWSEEPIRNQNNTNQYQGNRKKKHKR